jgi:site-specific DNA-methyltransferase (adenine-specific)
MDCLVGMQEIPDNSVDCIICDLPYGTTACEWDSVIPFEPLWEQYKRIAREDAPILLFSKQPFTSRLVLSNLEMFRYELIWEKTRHSNNMQLGKQPAAIHENIDVFYKKQPVFNEQKFNVDPKYIDKRKSINNAIYNSEHYTGTMTRKADDGTRHSQSILPFNSVWEKDMHPTQKPVDLLRYLIRTYSNVGATILDNCMGSGTTAVAAVMEKRKFIGFETNKEYCDKANARLKKLTGPFYIYGNIGV